MLLGVRIALIVAISGLVVFIADYTRMTRGAAWRDPVGQTIILAELFLIGTLMPFLLAAFFRLSTLGSQIGVWVLTTFLFLTGGVMYWRTWVFERIHRRGKKDDR